jgi:DNA-binding CsgD family transcriptional regulator
MKTTDWMNAMGNAQAEAASKPGAIAGKPRVAIARERQGGEHRIDLLSSRERDVLHWLAHGKTGDEVGMILCISVCTVRAHVRNIVRKLNASNIAHAVARGFRSGLLDRQS